MRGGEVVQPRLECGDESARLGAALARHRGEAPHHRQQILDAVGQLAIEQLARLVLEPPLGHVVARPGKDRRRSGWIALDHAPLVAQEAELARVLAANAELVRERGVRRHRLAHRRLQQRDVVWLDQGEESARRKSEQRWGQAEQLRQPRADPHHVFGDVPFPQRDGARLDGAAEPPGIGEQRRQGAASP